jgi:pimeloyl-ACP methyl ester carboxylesterase
LIQAKWLELSGSRTRVLEAGGDPARTVVFLHGVTSSAATWTPFLTALPDGVRGIAYDALGCGYTERSGPRRPITPDDLRAQLVELTVALGVERFTAVGHSMGCGASLGLAWRAPGGPTPCCSSPRRSSVAAGSGRCCGSRRGARRRGRSRWALPRSCP